MNAFDASVIVISHTACLPAKGLRRNSHQCYISSRTQSAFSFFEALHKRVRFRDKCYTHITHCMSACKRFAAQFSSMLHLLNATSLHGLSQRFHFLKHCTRVNAFDTSVIVRLPATGLRRNSHQCYISSMLHLFIF